jgi:hypothetical protein
MAILVKAREVVIREVATRLRRPEDIHREEVTHRAVVIHPAVILPLLEDRAW